MGGEEWLLWRDGAHDPWFNMAADELLLQRTAEFAGRVLVRIYRWDRPAVSFGYSQIYPAELRDRYTVVRRPTGGGVVWHDVDLTYTVVVPPGHAIMKLDRMESYRIFHRALLAELGRSGVAAALAPEGTPGVERATMRCFVSPSRYDVVAPDGGKYAGAAQRRTRLGILHQGSIMLEAAQGSWERLESELLRSLEREFAVTWAAWNPPDDFPAAAARLGRSKYASADWNERHIWEEAGTGDAGRH